MKHGLTLLCGLYVAVMLAGLLLMGADEQSVARAWTGALMVLGINLLYIALGVWSSIVSTLFGVHYGSR